METFQITLLNGTSITAKLNGNCFVTTEEIALETLNDNNLISVMINEKEYHNYHCVNFWKEANEYWFILNEKTAEELKMEELNAKIEFLMAMQGVN